MQTNNSTYRMLGMAVLFTLLQGCDSPKSSSSSGKDGGPMPTSRMTIDYRVEASDTDVAVVRANVNDGKALPTSYRLDGGDYFRACVNGVCHNMADNESLSSPDYIARFDFQPGMDYVVSFNRQEAMDAPDSHVTLPPAFSIVTPANRQQVSDGDSVMVSWSPTGAPASVSLIYASDCKLQSGSHVYGSGTLSTDANADGQEPVSIDPIVDTARTGLTSPITRCNIAVTVRHQLEGRIDPGFHGGTAVGIVSRVVNLDYVPR